MPPNSSLWQCEHGNGLVNVLAYNLKRVMHISGFKQTMKARLSMGGCALHLLKDAPRPPPGPFQTILGEPLVEKSKGRPLTLVWSSQLNFGFQDESRFHTASPQSGYSYLGLCRRPNSRKHEP
jgi:hypothetical protein